MGSEQRNKQKWKGAHKEKAAKPVYRQQYGLITLCASEREQARLYERLTRMGLRVRVVTT